MPIEQDYCHVVMAGWVIRKEYARFSVVQKGLINPARGSQVIRKKLFESRVRSSGNDGRLRKQLHAVLPILQVVGGGRRKCQDQAQCSHRWHEPRNGDRTDYVA